MLEYQYVKYVWLKYVAKELYHEQQTKFSYPVTQM